MNFSLESSAGDPGREILQERQRLHHVSPGHADIGADSVQLTQHADIPILIALRLKAVGDQECDSSESPAKPPHFIFSDKTITRGRTVLGASPMTAGLPGGFAEAHA